MKRRLSWRTGFDINVKVARFLPVVSLVAAVAGFASWGDENTDMRLTPFPLLMAIALWCLVGCGLGVLRVHRGESRLVTFGGWWTALALLGLSGFLAAIALGGSIGITDEEAGWLAWPPFLATTFGMVTIAPAMAVLAWGSLRASVLPIYASVAMFAAAPLVPLSMYLGGNVFGEVGFIGTVVLFTVVWIVIGSSLTVTDRRNISHA